MDKMRRGLWVGAVALVVVAAISVANILGVTKTANAVLLDGEFEDSFIQPSVDLSADGYWAWLAGDVACTEGERVEVNAWIVQPSTGAEAEGSWHGSCTGAPELWNTGSTPSQNAYSFEEGPAEVCATAWTRSNSGTTDIFQGCSEVEAAPTA
jgi:hypothetical protein